MSEVKDWKLELRTLARAASDALDLLGLYNAPAAANGTPAPFRGAPHLFDEGPSPELARRGVAPSRDVRTACQRAGIRGAEAIARHLAFSPWQSYSIPGDTVTWTPAPFEAPDAPALAVTLAATLHVAMSSVCDGMTGLLRQPRGTGSDGLAFEQRVIVARALVRSLVREHIDSIVGVFAWNPPMPPKPTAAQRTAALVGVSVEQVEAGPSGSGGGADDDGDEVMCDD